MGRIAYVFAGQGDQYPGMGKNIWDRYDIAKDVYKMCDEIRPGTSKQCFEGTEEELKQTDNTQPCLFAMELAAAKVLLDKGIKPDVAAGFSLGEVTAAAFAGIVDERSGFTLVCRRGELMQRAAEQFDISMMAVVKLSNEQVESICDRYENVYPVNYNCPGQVTVSGLTEQMVDFSADVRAAGGRAIPLKVKGAFHSPFMKEAAQSFAGELRKCPSLNNTGGTQITLYSDVTAQPYTEDIVKLLSKQICSPVRWEQIIRNMIADGVDTFVEIGPGKTLSNMIKKIDASVNVTDVGSYIEDSVKQHMKLQGVREIIRC